MKTFYLGILFYCILHHCNHCTNCTNGVRKCPTTPPLCSYIEFRSTDWVYVRARTPKATSSVGKKKRQIKSPYWLSRLTSWASKGQPCTLGRYRASAQAQASTHVCFLCPDLLYQLMMHACQVRDAIHIVAQPETLIAFLSCLGYSLGLR